MNIHAFWKSVLAQDREAMRSYFHEDAVINWHCTGERFTLEEFIRANCDYPGQWDGEVERVEEMGDLIISAVRVFPKDLTASFHVVSFIRLKDDRIVSADEYWADDGPVPEWRRKMNIGTSVR